jgi:hypothetical protein
MRTPRTLAIVAGLALAVSPATRADDARTRDAARAVLARGAAALVTVRLTVKSRMVFEGREASGPESTLEVQGTVISPDGLTVVSDFTTNPGSVFQRAGGMQVESETSDVKLLLQDGREVPARFVLRDADLDLAFLAPVEPIARLPFVKLGAGPVPAPLDELVVLGQLGPSLGREVAVTVVRVRAVVKRPRTFVVPSFLDGLMGLGGPVFDDRGRPVGLLVLRRGPRASDAEGFRDTFDTLQAVVLTGADVQDLTAQAVAARKAAKDADRGGAAAP